MGPPVLLLLLATLALLAALEGIGRREWLPDCRLLLPEASEGRGAGGTWGERGQVRGTENKQDLGFTSRFKVG